MVECSGYTIGKRDNLIAIQCKAHGYIHLNPIPEENQYFNGNYHLLVKPNIAKEYAEDSKWWSMIYGDWLSLVHPSLNKWAIDIGAGTGNWVRYLRLNGWLTQGIEPDPNLAKQHGFIRGSWRNAELKGVSLISAHWVLEHVADPADFLQWAHKTLCDEGVVMITVPNDFTAVQYEAAKRINRPYYWLNEDHANYFNKNSLRLLLERNGFQIRSSYGAWQPERYLRPEFDYTRNAALGRHLHKERMLRETRVWTPIRRFVRYVNGLMGVGRDLTVIAEKM